MAKKTRKITKKAAQQPKAAVTEPASPQAPINAMDVLKEKMKQANKGGLLDALNQVKNTKPEDWKDADRVKDLAKKLASSMNLPINNDRLDQFMKAYKDATKGGEPEDPSKILQKYGQGKIDPQSMNDIQKFIK